MANTTAAPDDAAVDTTVTANDIKPMIENLAAFMPRYTEHLYDRRQVPHADTYIRGLLSDLERKTITPIADRAELPDPRPLQRFVGEGRFDDALLIAELQSHVAEEIGDPAGILVGDPSCFEKKGEDSVGVQRQWNGRRGKVDNCQKGCFLGYLSPGGTALIDRRLYLPQSWADNSEAREKCHVPPNATFRTAPELTMDMIDEVSVPYLWFVADEEFGRPPAFRAGLRERNKLYAIEVPSNMHVRPVRRGRKGQTLLGTEQRVRDLLRSLKPGSWNRVFVKAGTKEPIYVQAADIDVMTKADGSATCDIEERLTVVRILGPKVEYKYVISNTKRSAVCIGAVVRAMLARHLVEEAFERAKGEAGLAHYEVRSWVGWHHHITLAFLAAWFLELERRRFRDSGAHDHGATRRAGHRDDAA